MNNPDDDIVTVTVRRGGLTQLVEMADRLRDLIEEHVTDYPAKAEFSEVAGQLRGAGQGLAGMARLREGGGK